MPILPKSQEQRDGEPGKLRRRRRPPDPAKQSGLVPVLSPKPEPKGLGVEGKRAWRHIATVGTWLAPADAEFVMGVCRLADRIKKIERSLEAWDKDTGYNPLTAGGELIGTTKMGPDGTEIMEWKENPLAKSLTKLRRQYFELLGKLGFTPGFRTKIIAGDPDRNVKNAPAAAYLDE